MADQSSALRQNRCTKLGARTGKAHQSFKQLFWGFFLGFFNEPSHLLNASISLLRHRQGHPSFQSQQVQSSPSHSPVTSHTHRHSQGGKSCSFSRPGQILGWGFGTLWRTERWVSTQHQQLQLDVSRCISTNKPCFKESFQGTPAASERHKCQLLTPDG